MKAIGRYENPVARVMTAISVVIFPCRVAVAVGEFGLKKS
jgi:hypothetical protein